MAGVPVQVIYDPDDLNTDITNYVIYRSVRLETQFASLPGTWSATITDEGQDLDFATGKRILWKLDGSVFYAGFITQVSRTFAFPADDTSVPASVKTREFVLRGVDYNILFDRRFLRNPSNYLTHIPEITSPTYDGVIIKQLCDDYLDIPSWLDTDTEVDNITLLADGTETGLEVFDFAQQGSSWRSQMEEFYKLGDGIFYIRPYGTGARLVYKALEENVAPYVLSDKPVWAEKGFRELDHLIDGTSIVNDAMVWGGDEFGAFDTGGVTVFGRRQNTTSQDDNGRWQWAETHFGETNYASQTSVNRRAKSIVTGYGGSTPSGNRGLENPGRNYTIAWHQRNVPQTGSTYNFIYPGDLTTLKLHVFGDGVDPLLEVLPCRSIVVSFPGNDPSGDSHVRFEGTFSVQPDDPYTLWGAVARRRRRVTG
jgi:hypothetical protein